MKPAVLALGALLAAGCAFTPGTGFATLAGGQVQAPAVLGPARTDATGRWKTSNGYWLALDGGKLAIELKDVALQAPAQAAAAGTGGTFDPANPPPGYTFCHGNDCHRADGSVATFDEIKAELAGGGSAGTAKKSVAALKPAVARLELPLAAGGAWALAGCEPHCYLAQGSLSEATLSLGRLVASGTAVPTGGGEPRAWTLDLALTGANLPAALSTTVGAEGSRDLALAGTFTLTDKLFDGLPWDRLLQAQGPVDLDADKEAAEALVTNLAKSTWTAKLEPKP